jgi:hypothetical protein
MWNLSVWSWDPKLQFHLQTFSAWLLSFPHRFAEELGMREKHQLLGFSFAHFVLFQDGVSLCCPGWLQTPGFNLFYCLSLLGGWDYRHVPPHSTPRHLLLCSHPSLEGESTNSVKRKFFWLCWLQTCVQHILLCVWCYNPWKHKLWEKSEWYQKLGFLMKKSIKYKSSRQTDQGERIIMSWIRK